MTQQQNQTHRGPNHSDQPEFDKANIEVGMWLVVNGTAFYQDAQITEIIGTDAIRVDIILNPEHAPCPSGAEKRSEVFPISLLCDSGLLCYSEHEVEVERRRQIGLTIDPTTAETRTSREYVGDPYDILGPEYHQPEIDGTSPLIRHCFARNPGASNDDWVNFDDLPEATRKALRGEPELDGDSALDTAIAALLPF
jgi:hypothetical protein